MRGAAGDGGRPSPARSCPCRPPEIWAARLLDGSEDMRMALAGDNGGALIGRLAPAGIGGDGSSAPGVPVSGNEQDGPYGALPSSSSAPHSPPEATAAMSCRSGRAPGRVTRTSTPSTWCWRTATRASATRAEALLWRGSVRRRVRVLAVDFSRVDAKSVSAWRSAARASRAARACACRTTAKCAAAGRRAEREPPADRGCGRARQRHVSVCGCRAAARAWRGPRWSRASAAQGSRLPRRDVETYMTPGHSVFRCGSFWPSVMYLSI